MSWLLGLLISASTALGVSDTAATDLLRSWGDVPTTTAGRPLTPSTGRTQQAKTPKSAPVVGGPMRPTAGRVVPNQPALPKPRANPVPPRASDEGDSDGCGCDRGDDADDRGKHRGHKHGKGHDQHGRGRGVGHDKHGCDHDDQHDQHDNGRWQDRQDREDREDREDRNDRYGNGADRDSAQSPSAGSGNESRPRTLRPRKGQ